jgi:DNA topoisomerase-1
MPGSADSAPAIVEPRAAAEEAGLRYVSDEAPGIGRRRRGKAFEYRLPGGGPVRDAPTLARIRALAIPPAWTQVWICARADGHIQATGRDARGRKQYRYHARWRDVRDAAKYGHMLDFAQALPAIRARVEADLQRPGLPRRKVLATVVRLLETTLIRVGNDDYARANGSFGLTTLRNRHVTVAGSELRFTFKGKSGRSWQLGVQDRRIARIVRACQDLPGQELFGYRDPEGVTHDIGSADVNGYLREISGRDITAKDFRTWSGTVLAAMALRECEGVDTKAAARRNVKTAIEKVAARLGNTPTICRKCYVHPFIVDGYLDEGLVVQLEQAAADAIGREQATLRPEESAVLALLLDRLRGRGEGDRRSAGRARRAGTPATRRDG